MKPCILVLGLAVSSVVASAQSSSNPAYVDLQALFDTDVVLEEGGAGLTAPLDPARDRVDARTLPAAYQDGAPVTSQDGRASFRFAPLRKSSLDAVAVNGQVLDVADQAVASVDLSLLSATGSYANPFATVQFRYTDGTQDEQRLGPVPGWFASPTAFDHTLFRYTDSSSVKSLYSFRTDAGDTEATYLYQTRGNGISGPTPGGDRFIDGTGYALYLLPIDPSVPAATLGITVGNNFVVSLATEFHDPQDSFTDGYTEVANSMKLYNGFEHRALGNLKLYEFDLTPFLAFKTGELYVLLTDATPANGWGPYVQNLSVYTGVNRSFEQTLSPRLNTNNATVYAEFLANGEEPERPYLYDNSGSGPSNRRHRFADGAGSITYRFDLPDDVTDAKATLDLANNFVVSIAGPTTVVRYARMAPGAADEKTFLVDEGNSILGGSFRFADGNAYMVYEFDLPDDTTKAVAQISVGNQFVIALAAGREGEFETVKDWVAETGAEPRDLSNLGVYDFPLDAYLANNPEKIVRIRLADGQPSDGWGPYLTGISIVNQTGTGQQVFRPMLNSMDMFGEDIHDEFNKGYYTIDLGSVLTNNNPRKEVFVKLTDQSTSDGWGPGIFWMAVHRGTLGIESDARVFNGLKAVNGEPAFNGASLLYRRYEVNAAKTLKDIVLPAASALETSKVYLLAATLSPAAAATSPGLTLQRQANDLQLSWPTSAVGYELQSAASVKGPWARDGAATSVVGDRNVAVVTPSGAAKFYRLARP